LCIKMSYIFSGKYIRKSNVSYFAIDQKSNIFDVRISIQR
jgi:hypothetical protein